MRIGLKLTAAFLAIASLVAAAGYIAQRTDRELKQQVERLSHSAIWQMAVATEVTIALYADQLAAHEQIMTRRRSGAAEKQLGDCPDSRAAKMGLSPSEIEKLFLGRPLGTGGPSSAEAQARRDQPDRRHEMAEKDVAMRAAERGTDELIEPVRSQAGPSMQQLKQEVARHQELMNRFRGLLDEDVDAAERFLEDQICHHFEKELLPRLVAIREQSERESTGGIRTAERALVVAAQRRGILLIATAAIAVSIGLFMSRSIGKPLSTLQRAAQEIGRGRLDTRVAIRSRDEIGTLAASLNQMAAELREKTVSKDYVDNIIHSMQEMLIVADPHQRIRLVNPAACSELGYDAAELADRPLQDLFGLEGPLAEGGLSPTEARSGEGFMQTKPGDHLPVHFSAAEMRDEAGQPAGIVCVALNVSRQKETEHRLRASLREKELLLKEVHHRVKNNLQVISSLLSLQAQHICDPQMSRLFQESQARVRSMALIHEQLYRSNDLAHIDFAAYVQELVGNLRQGFGGAAARVDFCLDIQPVPLLLDLAIPCGMIVNELVANALEHAFPEDRPGEIRIAFGRAEGVYCITVADNGVGMREGLAVGEGTSIGLKVVQALTRQIHGRLDHAYQEGTVFTIRFDPRAAGPNSLTS
jgi:PAS domain S-box-containing protein